MYMDTRSMAMNALNKALDFREDYQIAKKDSFCIFDYAEKAGCEVKFVDISSMEGLYVRSSKKNIILLSSHPHRPAGRQRFTCAHELGHYLYGHSVHIDEIESEKQKNHRDEQEVIADFFASFLLMPSSTVVNGFVRRGWDLKKATPLQVYIISWWLGVGYQTLVNHLQYGIKKISKHHATALSCESPKDIKRRLLGEEVQEDVIPIDFYWSGRPIDAFTSDFLVTEEPIFFDSDKITPVTRTGGKHIYKLLKPGLVPIGNEDHSWSSFVRISKSRYFGRGKYRHLEDE